jgi:hypothetical protein
MLKLLFGFVLLGALALAVCFVPLRGRTVLDRWNTAPSASAFAARGLREGKVALGLEKEAVKAPRAQASRPARPAPPPAAARPHPPVENLRPEDRAALDRIVEESARR